MSDPSEHVLVVPRAVAVPIPWHGLRTDPGGIADLVGAMKSEGRFVLRSAAEADPTAKQIIPYLVLRDGPHWFLMRRTRRGGDERLHDRWSIGIGGHLNPGDTDLDGGLLREWSEELEAAFVPPFRPVGLINDDASPVGAVHLGVVYMAEADGRPVGIRESDKLEGGFATGEQVAAVRDRLETWSRIIFDAVTRSVAVERL
ncbi:MAG: hypothetical protein IVW53_01255 [Chloroflexi bacterium]|nr:hypothetical protein [Chloroflexota bacterium]